MLTVFHLDIFRSAATASYRETPVTNCVPFATKSVCSGSIVHDCLIVQYETTFEIPTCKCHDLTNQFLGHLSFYRLR